MRCPRWLSTALGVVLVAQPAIAQKRAISSEAGYTAPVLPFEPVDSPAEAMPTETLADAIERAYRTNPTLGAGRYDLRATDEGIAQARALLRPKIDAEVSAGYGTTIPGRTTQASRPILDQITSPTIDTDTIETRLVVEQPLSTGGRASAAIAAAEGDVRAGREGLRGLEGNLIVQVIATYVDVRRDTQIAAIRQRTVAVLEALLAEIVARRRAGELTRTDIAQGETQLASARVAANTATAQLEDSRSRYATLVGADPGALAPEPPLPLLPATVDAAFGIAARDNPDLAQAIQTERASRARIAGARAEGRPSLALRGTYGTTGPLQDIDATEHDQTLSGRLVLTIPLAQGGRVASLAAQAADRNAADRLRIEAARRTMIQNIANAWNQAVTSARNIEAQTVQRDAARVYYEGSFAEYRAGLRSTFDVLFAQNSLREAEVALLGSRRDRYVAQATLLRHIGQLEAGKIMTGTGLYRPEPYTGKAIRRSVVPWEGAVRALDGVTGLRGKQIPVEQPERVVAASVLADAPPAVNDAPLSTVNPVTPIPGTLGAPKPRKRP